MPLWVGIYRFGPLLAPEQVGVIFEGVFECTLSMITKNFEDYPEHRLRFFSLLRSLSAHCFPALVGLPSGQLALMLDSIFWAIRHTERNVAETGLMLLLELLRKFEVGHTQYIPLTTWPT